MESRYLLRRIVPTFFNRIRQNYMLLSNSYSSGTTIASEVADSSSQTITAVDDYVEMTDACIRVCLFLISLKVWFFFKRSIICRFCETSRVATSLLIYLFNNSWTTKIATWFFELLDRCECDLEIYFYFSVSDWLTMNVHSFKPRLILHFWSFCRLLIPSIYLIYAIKSTSTPIYCQIVPVNIKDLRHDCHSVD